MLKECGGFVYKQDIFGFFYYNELRIKSSIDTRCQNMDLGCQNDLDVSQWGSFLFK